MPRGLYSDFSKRSLPQCTPRGIRRSTIRKSGGRYARAARPPSWWWGGSERTICSSCLYLNGKEAKSIGSARSPHWCARHLLRAQAASRSRKSSRPPQPRRRGRRRRSTRVHQGRHPISTPSSIWIFVERYLVRNFFPCNFQSSKTRSFLSLRRNKKWYFGSITSTSYKWIEEGQI